MAGPFKMRYLEYNNKPAVVFGDGGAGTRGAVSLVTQYAATSKPAGTIGYTWVEGSGYNLICAYSDGYSYRVPFVNKTGQDPGSGVLGQIKSAVFIPSGLPTVIFCLGGSGNDYWLQFDISNCFWY